MKAITKLSDRLVRLLVPTAAASADSICWWTTSPCGPGGNCDMRGCITPDGTQYTCVC
jgi:hypothetical protein